MGVWANIEGSVKILKKDNISIKKVIEDTLTDEFWLNIDTTSEGDCYSHRVDCNLEIDGYYFIKHHKEFFEALKPIKGGMDLTFKLRFL